MISRPIAHFGILDIKHSLSGGSENAIKNYRKYIVTIENL